MRPIKLKIRGLNSFEEEQAVDFTKLTKRGLFGIFGPTGSGKSTVLDGMILALYGMKAISRGANEFINKNCQSAAVSYEFQISAKNAKRYRAEREFKAGSQGVKAGKCRLLDITEGEVVLEDTVRGMDRACADIIGLNAEDFMRTVVLPQGKFSEFLRVSGKDRREILERLFGLEEYGKRLEEKIAQSLREVQEKKTNLRGQMEAYGMAGREELREKEQQEKQCRQKLEELNESIEQMAGQLKEHREVWELTERLLDGEKHLGRLTEQAATVEKRELALRQADQAKSIAPLLTSYQELREKSELISRKIREKELEYGKLERQAKELEKRFQEAFDEKELKEQPLRCLLQNAKEALEYWSSLPRLQKEMKKLEDEKKGAEKKAEELEAGLAETKKAQVSGQRQIEGLETECGEYKVQAKYREQIEEGLRLEEKAEKLYRELEKQQRKIKGYLKRIKKEEERKEELVRKSEESGEKCRQLSGKLEKQKRDIRAYQAYLLRRELKEGMPCPVCGAIHHEAQTDDVSASRMPETEDAEESEAKLKEMQEQQQEIRSKIEGCRSVLAMLNEQLGEESSVYEEMKKNCELANAELGRKKEELKLKSFSMERMRLLEKAERLEQQEQRLVKLRKAQKSFRARQEEQQRFKESCKERISGLSVRLAPLKEAISEKNARIEEKVGKGQNPEHVICRLEQKIESILAACAENQKSYESAEKKRKEAELNLNQLQGQRSGSGEAMEKAKESLEQEMQSHGFLSIRELENAFLDEGSYSALSKVVESYYNELKEWKVKVREMRSSLGDRSVLKETLSLEEEQFIQMQNESSCQKECLGELRQQVKNIKEGLRMQAKLSLELKATEHRESILEDLKSVTRGKRFVEFMASKRLKYISKSASLRLSEITNGNYELETVGAGEFMIRDNKNGGVLRSPGTLSGGETFVTSLALALSLSAEIQLKGTAPLELFFLDEGFGSLDESLLDVVMTSLEGIQNDNLKVGIISHVEAVKARVPVRLAVTPAASGISGSRLHIEYS